MSNFSPVMAKGPYLDWSFTWNRFGTNTLPTTSTAIFGTGPNLLFTGTGGSLNSLVPISSPLFVPRRFTASGLVAFVLQLWVQAPAASAVAPTALPTFQTFGRLPGQTRWHQHSAAFTPNIASVASGTISSRYEATIIQSPAGQLYPEMYIQMTTAPTHSIDGTYNYRILVSD